MTEILDLGSLVYPVVGTLTGCVRLIGKRTPIHAIPSVLPKSMATLGLATLSVHTDVVAMDKGVLSLR